MSTRPTRMRATLGLGVVATLAACQVAPPAKVQAPAGRPSAGPAAAKPSAADPAAATSPAGLAAAAAPRLLAPPAGVATKLTGQVLVDAAYATRAGAASRLTAADGALLVGMDGATLAADGTVTAGGRVVGTKGGNVVVPAGLIGADGATLIGSDGATLVGADGGTLIGNDGGSLIGADGGTLIGNDGGSYRLHPDAYRLPPDAYRLAQAEPGGGAPAAGMWVSVVDTTTGFTVPLGKDPTTGADVHAVYTDAAGRFAVHLDPAVAARARVVARAPGRRDARLTLSVFARGGGEARVDDAAALLTTFVRQILARRLVGLFALEAASPAPGPALGPGAGSPGPAPSKAPTPTELMLGALGVAGAAPILDAMKAIKADQMAPERRAELALLMADRLLAETDYEAMTFGPLAVEPLDPASRAALPGRNVVAELRGLFGRLEAAAQARLQSAGAAADPAPWFAGRPWLVAANLDRPEGERWRLDTPADVVRFAVDAYLAHNDHEQFKKVQELINDLGLGPGELDRLNAIGQAFVDLMVGTLVANSERSGKPNAELVRESIETAGRMLAEAPPPRLPSPVRPAALPVPAAPDAGAWAVDTLAGAAGVYGHVDGAAAAARFRAPAGVAVDARANPPVLYVADAENAVIRKVVLDPAGAVVTTVAGAPGAKGRVDGRGGEARFQAPQGLALDGLGRLYVADVFGHAIRRLTFGADGVATVETLAGDGTAGFTDGAGGKDGPARFNQPRGLALDPNGDVVVADTFNHRLRRIALSRGGVVETILGDGRAMRAEGPMKVALVEEPSSVAFDAAGALYFVQMNHTCVRKVEAPIGPDAPTRVVAGAGRDTGPQDGFFHNAWFSWPQAIAFDAKGRLVVADTGGHRVRLVTPDGWAATLAGGGGPGLKEPGAVDGVGEGARFNMPHGVAVGPDGTVYVPDAANHTIRRLRPR